MATIDFGSDYSTFRGDGTYGLTYVRITGPRVPLEGVARLWLTSPGDLFWADDLGFNLLRLENAGKKASQIPQYQHFLRSVAKRVDFVLGADVTVSFAGNALSVSARITLADGTPHPLLVSAADAGAAVVQFPSAPLVAA